MNPRIAIVGVLAALAASTLTVSSATLEEGFTNPPEQTRPWCYWYWINDNLSREGITRDLEAMARAGIGEALIGNIFLDGIPAGKTKVLSEEWWGMVEHAIREGGRVGVNISLFNCPGWSQSGGPWIKPEQAMRYLVSSETRVHGPGRFQQKLPAPAEPFQDVALLAFPAPQQDTDALAAHSPKVTCTPAAPGVENLTDGNPGTAMAFPGDAGTGKKAFTIDIVLARPLTARSLSLVPSESAWAAQCELQSEGADGKFRALRAFKFDRSNMRVNVGPMPRGPVTVSFTAATAKRLRLVFTGITGPAALAEINLSGAARLESFVEKQLGKMHPTPLPMWDAYLWPERPEPESAALTIPKNGVLDLSARLAPDATLRWEVPPGDWIILRTGMTLTGTRNSPSSPEGQGLEVDKMNRAAAKVHFNAFIGQLLRRMPAAERKALRHVVADSYEMGSENWTDGFAKTFRERYGYDPKPWLPVLTGRIIGSADLSDRFLWDLRRLVADHIATDYVGGLRELCRPHGLRLWLENYGHWGFPAEFLQYGSQTDDLGGEFWVRDGSSLPLGSVELRAASSCANTYGKRVVSAEAFTSGIRPFQLTPAALKTRGDWAFCEGINHFVLHVYIHQPWEDRHPGVNAWFGTEFNRHNTWFAAGRAWVDYLRRCSFLLQQGARVADVAYFIGEDAPKMTGLRQPELPPGRDFDYINAEVIEHKLGVKNGVLTLPHGTTYRVLVLPEMPTMRPALLRKLRDLVKAGATIVGRPPLRSPSLEHYPQCDEEVRKLAGEIWCAPPTGPAASKGSEGAGEHKLGQGRVIWGKSLGEVFAGLGSAPDFQSGVKLRFTHRAAGGTHIYFVANPEPRELATLAVFRAGGGAPELWWPDTGRIEHPALYDEAGGVVRLPIHLDPSASVFVVFREPAASSNRIASVKRNGELLLDARKVISPLESNEPGQNAANSFTLAAWVKPEADTTLPAEANQGVHGLGEPRNDAIYPPHGSSFGDASHAGCGLAVGRNGVCVFEHGANYFTPVLVHAARLADWTHVAVVYRDGQPSLYLNGVFARRGLKSDRTVHPGDSPGGGRTPFQGELGAIEQQARPCSEAEITQWMKRMPRPGSPLAASAIEINQTVGGELMARVWQPGNYELLTANDRTHTLQVASLPAPLELAGPWETSFTPGWGAPEKLSFAKLEDWTRRPEEGIRHYSGKATYRITFVADPKSETQDSKWILDLGEVRDLATVRLNRQYLGTLWTAPWRVDATSALRAGRNDLEIEVVNPWNNRIVGDAALPAEKRFTFLATPTVKTNAPLMSAGLLGPVRLIGGRMIPVNLNPTENGPSGNR